MIFVPPHLKVCYIHPSLSRVCVVHLFTRLRVHVHMEAQDGVFIDWLSQDLSLNPELADCVSVITS